MSKPMLVTLPFVLLLLDFWPLNRFQIGQPGCSRLVFEKIPLFLISAFSCVVTYMVQKSGGAVVSLTIFPFLLRVENAIVSYVVYIGKMFWPVCLAVYYPHPASLPWWQVAGACLLLLIVTLLAVSTAKRYPWFATGWLWYMGTLVPVIGIVQVGTQALADRYTYVPLIGLFIIIAWGVPELASRLSCKKKSLTTIAAILISILTANTWLQAQHWKSSVTLFEHALHATSNSHIMHNNLGLTLAKQGKTAEAVVHYVEALRINPKYAAAHCNLGLALDSEGKPDEAAAHFSEALRINLLYADAHNGLGLIRAKQGRMAEAMGYFSEALRINPLFAEAHSNLGVAMMREGKIEDAIVHFQEALRIKPGLTEVNINLKTALEIQGE
jgi:Flp pilus assembly protein TadD